ncbi:MAG: MerR family transcriptional regulator [Vallitaleaceae bacterium]|nr:MerR family transcriptional regulator [Vallitaleaceae bacterium]
MKIGQFASKHQTSIDTIRHYMSLGLLIPQKASAQYDFDDTCSNDFNEIMELKNIGFTLNEIQQLILYRRIGKLTEYDQRITYTSFFEKKNRQIVQEIHRLSEMKLNLDKAIEVMKAKLDSDSTIHGETIGLPLSSLNLFACPLCHEPFEITEGNILNGTLINATLTCPCSYQLTIKEGIVYTPNLISRSNETVQTSDLKQYSENYIDEYINTTDVSYLKKLLEGLNWSSRHISPETLKYMVALELGSGHGFFIRHVLDQFPEGSTYIAVDHNPIKSLWLKKIIERSHPKANILFLCADFTQLPLKPNTVDVLLDISGSSNYSFEHSDFLLDHIDPILKRNARLHAYYILFENFASTSKIPLSLRDGFRLQQIKAHLKALDYECLNDFTTAPVEKGGPLEDYFVDGEQVKTYLYNGVKVTKPLG